MPRKIAVAAGLPRSKEERDLIIDKVRVAEEVGVQAAFTAETWGRDQITFLTQLAMATSRIELGTGIAPVFGRSPGVLASTMASLDEISGGRMILGLGTSGARVIEHWHGVPFEKPLRRLREYVEIFNLMISGERVVYDGEIFKLNLGFRLDMEPVRKKIPVYIAGITPKSIRQIGEVADGWMPIYWPRSRYGEGRALIEQGAESAGRSADDVTVCPVVTTVISDDVAAAREQARGPVSFYIGRMGVFYAQMLTRNGFPDEVKACQAAWEARDPAAANGAISERMVDETALAGPPGDIGRGVDDLAEHGVDLPILSMPGGSLQETEDVLGTIVNG